MSPCMQQTIKVLLDAYIQLNAMHADPGQKAHMLAYSIAFVQKQIKRLIEHEVE